MSTPILGPPANYNDNTFKENRQLTKNKVVLFDSFLEDKRVSINHISEQVCTAGLALNPERFEFNLFRPKFRLAKTPLPKQTKFRVAKFLDYPLQVVNTFCDVAHVMEDGSAHLSPFIRAKKKVITFTDMIPLLGYLREIEGLTYPHHPLLYKFCLRFIKSFDHITTFSENNKNELIFRLNIPSEKITVVPLGVDQAIFAAAHISRKEARIRLKLPQEKTIIMVSGSEQYKNLGTSFKAINRMMGDSKREEIQVVRLGGPSDIFQKLAIDHGLEHNIFSFTGLSRQDVGFLYRASDLLLFPSFYEGFGIPPLEAMAAGTPTIVSDRASLPEVVGQGGIMVDCLDDKAIADHADILLKDSSKYKAAVEYGLSRARKFTWHRYVETFTEIYESLLKN